MDLGKVCRGDVLVPVAVISLFVIWGEFGPEGVAFGDHPSAALDYEGLYYGDCIGVYGPENLLCKKLVTIDQTDTRIHDLEDENVDLRQSLSGFESAVLGEIDHDDWSEIAPYKPRKLAMHDVAVKLEINIHDRSLFKFTFTDADSGRKSEVEYSVIIGGSKQEMNGVFRKESSGGIGYVLFPYGGLSQLHVCITEINGRDVERGRNTDRLEILADDSECTTFRGITLEFNPGQRNSLPDCWGVRNAEWFRCYLDHILVRLQWIERDLAEENKSLKQVKQPSGFGGGKKYGDWALLRSSGSGYDPKVDVNVYQNRHDQNLFKIHFNAFYGAVRAEYSADIWDGGWEDGRYYQWSNNGLGYVQFGHEGSLDDFRVCVTMYDGDSIDYGRHVVVRPGDPPRIAECNSYPNVSLGQDGTGIWRPDRQ